MFSPSRRRAVRSVAYLAAAAALGCGGGGLPRADRAKVSGTVTAGGKPLASGDITFTLTSMTEAEGGKIQGGRYELMAPVGMNSVRVTAGPNDGLPPDIPPGILKYQQHAAEVKAGQENKVDIELKPPAQ